MLVAIISRIHEFPVLGEWFI